MDPPTIHQLPTLILQPTRTSACPFTPYTGFIAGHICVPDGGGEDSLVTLSPALSESFRCWTPPVDPDPIASFPDLVAVPPDTAASIPSCRIANRFKPNNKRYIDNQRTVDAGIWKS
jgi:hypothetical protein